VNTTGADSWTIDDFVTLFFRRCSKLGLKLVQIPEYFCGSNLQVHPYRAQPYIPPALPDAQMKDLVRRVSSDAGSSFSEAASDFLDPKLRSLYLEKCVLFDRPQEWLRDDDRRTDWPAYLVDAAENAFSLTLGVGTPASASANTASALTAATSVIAATTSTASSSSVSSSAAATAVQGLGGIGRAVGVDASASGSEVTKSNAAAGNNPSSSSTSPPPVPAAPTLGRVAVPGGRRSPAQALAPQDRQYMHRSGLACVRVVPSGGFVWLLNSSARVGHSWMILFVIVYVLVCVYF
jgi:hypothetical protein